MAGLDIDRLNMLGITTQLPWVDHPYYSRGYIGNNARVISFKARVVGQLKLWVRQESRHFPHRTLEEVE